MMQAFFEDIARGIEARLATDPGEFVARKTFAMYTARLGARLYAGEGGVAWAGVLAPFDLLHAMGITSCYVEFVGASLAGNGFGPPMLERAEQLGYPTDSCSYHRAVTGAADQGLMPVPDFLIGTSAPCSGGLAVLENLAAHFDRPLHVIHVPQGTDDGSVAFLADQLRRMVAFVAEQTGRPMDPARLAAAIERTNEARGLWVEVNELAKTVPSPARRKDLFNLGIVMALFLGTDAAVEVARAYRDEFARKVADGIPGLPGEQLRLMWLQNRIQFETPLEGLLEQHGAAVVLDELNDVHWDPIDPDDPYPGTARRILSVPLCASAGRRIDNLVRLAGEYHIDGAINPCNWGCRQGTGSRGLIDDALRDVGVPTVNLEVDCIDARPFAEGQLRTRLEAFVEMLRDRKFA